MFFWLEVYSKLLAPLGLILYLMTTEKLWGLSLPIILSFVFIVIDKFLFYGTKSGRQIRYHSEFDLDDDTEVVVVRHGSLLHVVRMQIVRATDLVISAEDYSYSLTFCLLCNTVHAYKLPVIRDREESISSHGGLILNGNKVLMTRNFSCAWQQYSGKLISGKCSDLVSLDIIRGLWKHVQMVQGEFSLVETGTNLLARVLFTSLARILKGVGFVPVKVEGEELEPYTLVHGVSIIGVGAKAYVVSGLPYYPRLIEDEIKDFKFTLYTDGITMRAFEGWGLILDGNFIFDEHGVQYDLMGYSLEGERTLKSIPVTENSYYFAWKQTFPDSLVYYG